ncbi:hypothetical protein Tco_0403701 [Tanacetum coccineum]
MSEENQSVDVAALPKFDMPFYESEMTAKDVKSLAIRHGIPLDLHPVALTKGWTMDKLGAGGQVFQETFSGLKGWKKRFFFLDRRAIPDAMAWRHHDSDVNDPVPEDGFIAYDVQMLTERVVDLRPVPFGLLFQGGLATTWDFPVVTMSEYLRFPFLSGASISKGPALTSQDQIEQHTRRPLPSDQTIPEKTDHQKRVELEDPKNVATRERKARAAAKKREKRRQGGDGEEGSRPATKRKKITAESREDHSPRISPHGSANHSVHKYSNARHDNKETDTLWLGTSGDQSGRVMTNVNTEVVQPSPTHRFAYHSPIATQLASPPRSIIRGNVKEGESSRGGPLYVPDWSIHRRCRLDTPMWGRELIVHLVPSTTQEESNALNNATALEGAWFSLTRGALAQTDILERFKHLQADFESLAETHSECGETVGKLVQARLDLAHSSHLYTTLSDRYKSVKSEHENCTKKLEVLENCNSELSQVNKDLALRIKELEDELAKKDSALVYAERLIAERAQEKEKLVTQLSKTEMEKFDCIRKLLPTVVDRLFQSHEYKESLSGPFNLAIHAGWAKGLAEEHFEEGLLELMSRMEGFDAYADKKMYVEYDKLFEK